MISFTNVNDGPTLGNNQLDLVKSAEQTLQAFPNHRFHVIGHAHYLPGNRAGLTNRRQSDVQLLLCLFEVTVGHHCVVDKSISQSVKRVLLVAREPDTN